MPEVRALKLCKTNAAHIRKSVLRKHKDSNSAGTLFHKLKFPIRHAIWLVYLVVNSSYLQKTSSDCFLKETHVYPNRIQILSFILYKSKRRKTFHVYIFLFIYND